LSEIASSKKLFQVTKRDIFDPLGMTQTKFVLNASKSRIEDMSVASATTNWSRQVQHICPSSIRRSFRVRFKPRNLSGGCSLGRTAFTGDGSKGSSLNHPHQDFESTRSIDFQKKFKGHSKRSPVITPRHRPI
jgi:CubicO group peptidase (beta-lactamase class C family)